MNSPNDMGTILVVDDGDTNRFLLKAILTKFGYKVDECSNGKQCVERCNSETPSIILLDIMMPEMDGLAVCRELRQKFPKDELPIILVTTKTESQDIVEGLRSGANDYVTKPLDKTVLLARLENQLALREAHKQLVEQKELKERALEIQTAVGNVLPEAIIVEDQNQQIIYYNDITLRFLDSVPPKNIDELFENVLSGALLLDYHEIRTKISKEQNLKFREEIELDNQAVTNVELISSPVPVGDNTLYRLWVLKDISFTRGLQKKLAEQTTFEAMSTFTSGVAHNFNNLMGAISGTADILNRYGEAEPKIMRCVKIIRQSVDSSSKLIKRMYSLGSITYQENCKEGFGIIEALDGIISVQEEHAQGKVKFDVKVDQSIPNVRTTSFNLYNILTNVISNAVDAIKDSGVVKITATPAKEKGFILLTVSDTGVGMEQAVLDKIFSPFFSTKNMDLRNGVSMEGNGLGMWAVYSAVKKLGGDISVTSKVGIGTEVKLTLPHI